MIRASIIGFAHMHVNEVALYLSEQPDTVLCAVADAPCGAAELPPLRYTAGWNKENVVRNYCKNYYESYTEMLDREKPDIAYILTENIQKPAIVEACAARGINVCIEKPIAVSYDEAQRIKRAVDASGITAVVNWPVLWRPYIHKMKAALDKKIVGEPIKMHYLNGHTGPLGKGAKHRGVTEKAQEMTDEERAKTWWHSARFGGGAFLDIGCYGCFFADWLLGGGEKSVLSYDANLNTPFGDTEDNFASIIRYDGKMALIEGTWTTPRAVIPSGPSVLCTEGVVTCVGGAENAPDAVCFDIYGNPVAPEEPDMQGDKYKNMPCHYAHCLKTGEPIHKMLTLEENMHVMALLDAAVKSAKERREVPILG